MTVGNAFRDAVRRLAQAGVKSPQVDVEWLLADLLPCNRSEIPLHAQTDLPAEDLDRFSRSVERRTRREPLQHILGTANFFGYDFQVSAEVLIPRPETEVLVELALEFLMHLPNPSVFDLGTGSGCIALSLAKRCSKASIIGSDVSREALALARANAVSLVTLDQVEFRHADGLAAFAKGEQMDLILSNPPYIPTAKIDTLEPEVRDHDPRLALDGGADGMQFYRLLANEGQSHLKSGGKLMAEFGDGQAATIVDLFGQADWPSVTTANDLSHQPRILIASAGH